MTFTDAELQQFKEWVDDAIKDGFYIEGKPEPFRALLDRLAAAEDLILHHSITPIGYDDKYTAWQKAAGKI